MSDERKGARRSLRAGLAAATLVGFAGIPLRLAQLELVLVARPDVRTVARAALLDGLSRILAFVELAAVVLVAGLFARWTARLCDAARAQGVAVTPSARRRAVASWFVPFVQLARPPRVLASLVADVSAARHATIVAPDAGTGYRETLRRKGIAPTTVVVAWWSLWLASRAAEAVATAIDPQTAEACMGRLSLDLAADALMVCAGMLAQVVVGEVDEAVGGP